MNLTRKNWPSGWTPSSDDVNGDPSGLLRMDNLTLEASGIVSVISGRHTLTTGLSDSVYSMYSTVIGGHNAVYATLGAQGRQVIRSLKGDFSDTTTVCSDGGGLSAYGTALGAVLITNGTQAIKDDGTTVKPLGLADQLTGPQIDIQTPAIINIANGDWSVIEGILLAIHPDGGAGIQVQLDPFTLRANVLMSFSSPMDTTAFGDGVSDNFLTDSITFLSQLQDSSTITSVRMQILLDNDLTNPQNYYWQEFDIDSGQYNLGIDQQSIVGGQRQTFQRQGPDSSLDWTHVTGIQFVVIGTASTWALFDAETITGGPQGSLLGVYQYLTVAVLDNGIYQAKSAVSPFTNNILVQNSFVMATLTATDPLANQVWLFRRSMISSTDPIYQTFISQNLVPANLNDFFLVAQGPPGSVVEDNTSDIAALQTNITANQFLQSIQDLVVMDPIIGMEGLYFERMLYMSATTIYLSDPLNPDAIDTRYSIKAFSTATETNLWIKKVAPNILLLATTHDFYTIVGTLESQPDGSVDATISPVGEKYTSLSVSYAYDDSQIYYASASGIRSVSQSGSQLISPTLRDLFAGKSRWGVPGIVTETGNTLNYPLSIGQTKLYCVVPFTDGTTKLIIYDTVLQQWRLQDDGNNPTCVVTTTDDRVLVGYGGSTGIVQYETGLPDDTGFSVNLTTVYDDFLQPRNRKDTFTLKINCDCGGSTVNVFIGKDGDSYEQVGAINNNGQQTNYFPLSEFALGFRYAIKLTDVNLVKTFKIYEITIEYEPRPEQVDYMRILPTNLGTISRKRFTAFAFVIDTLGNDITFQTLVDNIASYSLSFQTETKLTQIVYFSSEVLGTDIGGILSGGVFEFYGVALEECISEKLPTPVQYLVIPANNYGTPARKRHTSYKFQLLTRGQDVQFTPVLDGNSYPPAIFNTTTKQTVEYFFSGPSFFGDIIAIDIGGILQTLSNTPFEYYGTITPQLIETLPDRLEYLVIPQNNYGTPNRKRHSSYKFQINTNGQFVTFTPYVDNVPHPFATFITVEKQTVEYFFESDTIGIDIAGILQAQPELDGTLTPFEFYGTVVPQTIETLPDRLMFFFIPQNNYGTPNRKRHTSYKFQINTNSAQVKFTPILDGVTLDSAATFFQTDQRLTVDYYFPTGDVIGVDIGGKLEAQTIGIPFEFYGTIVPQTVEKLPDLLRYFVIPANDYGVPNRKRHSSYKFQINTFGQWVEFTPIIDGLMGAPASYSTPSKQTVEYFFTEDTVSIDIGGTLSSETSTPFEFYGVVIPQTVEKLPDRLEFLKTNNTNFGAASPKRVRTIPIVIDTYGENVTFTPIVDGVLQSTTTTLNSTGKRTLYHYFSNDVFGTDFGGTFASETLEPFEFYEYGNPEDVESLPVPKKYDQLGPKRFDKIGKIFGFRLRLIATGTTTILPWAIYGDSSNNTPTYGVPIYTGSIQLAINIDSVYEVQLPKSVNSTMVRLTFGPIGDAFYRYDVQIKVSISGMESDSQWVQM